MPAMHAPFVQPSSVHGLSFSLDVFAVMPAAGDFHSAVSSPRSIAAQCHAPPNSYSPAPQPLRI